MFAFNRTNYLREVENLEGRYDTVNRILEAAPAETLHVRKGRSGIRYSVTVSDPEAASGGARRREVYLSRSDSRLPALIRQYCAAQLQPVMKKSLKALQNHPASYEPDLIEKKLQKLEDLFDGQMPAEFRSRRSYIENWKKADYPKSTRFDPKQKLIRTEKNDMVRSKLECIVANVLLHLNIPYRYEARLVLINGRAIFPDFTILSPINGKTYYLEVCGMMEKEAYIDDLLARVREMSESGIVLGDNLLLCFEAEHVPFDIQVLINMLQRTVLAPL